MYVTVKNLSGGIPKFEHYGGGGGYLAVVASLSLSTMGGGYLAVVASLSLSTMGGGVPGSGGVP